MCVFIYCALPRRRYNQLHPGFIGGPDANYFERIFVFFFFFASIINRKVSVCHCTAGVNKGFALAEIYYTCTRLKGKLYACGMQT